MKPSTYAPGVRYAAATSSENRPLPGGRNGVGNERDRNARRVKASRYQWFHVAACGLATGYDIGQ